MLYKCITILTKDNELILDSDIIEIDTKYDLIAKWTYKKILWKRVLKGEIQKIGSPVAIKLDEYIKDIEVRRWWLS